MSLADQIIENGPYAQVRTGDEKPPLSLNEPRPPSGAARRGTRGGVRVSESKPARWAGEVSKALIGYRGARR